MPAAANEADFEDPLSRRCALGEQVGREIFLDPSGHERLAVVNGGIIDPVRYDLPRNTRIYRFATFERGVAHGIGGGWWVERRELEQLIRFAQAKDRTLAYAVRLLCAVPPEWGGALNFLIAARTREPLACWRGLGRSAVATSRDGGPKTRSAIEIRNDIASLRLPQVFIPGLGTNTPDVPSPGATDWLAVDGTWQIEAAKDWLYRV